MIMEKPSILIVDDLPENLKLLSTLLSAQGYRVRPASSGEQALATIAKEKPDLILLDVMMPDLDGYTVCRRLKAEEETRDIPIIFLSALDGVQDKIAALKAGGVDYISKPFQMEEVLARVATHLELRRVQRALHEQNRLLVREVEERHRAEQALAEANRELQRLSKVDGLTQLPNRRHLDEYLEQQWARLGRTRQPLALILCDVDHFKSYNDSYGHQAGDDCLRAIAAELRDSLKRPGDLAARYGGEEFLLILPETDAAGALHLTEAIRLAVRKRAIEHAHSTAANRITLSFGVAVQMPGPGTSIEKLVAAADRALYAAKQAGRNRVVLDEGTG